MGSKDLKAAKQELAKLSAKERKAGIRHETAAYRKANERVAAAEKSVSWWRR
jgi:hypothetical protein